MYINEAPESTPNTELGERREEASRGRGNINKTTVIETGRGSITTVKKRGRRNER